jgi:Spy/CpxP family protein refolding chaperone
MKKLITLALASLLIAGSIAQVPVSGTQIKPKAHGHHHAMKGAMKALNLSPAQKSEMKAIHQKAKAQLMALKASKMQPAAKKAEIKAIKKATREQMMAILTPAQREKLLAMRASMKAHRGKVGKIQP